MRLRTSRKSLFLPPLARGGWGRFPEIPLAPPFLKGETNLPFPPFRKGGNRRHPGLLSPPLTRYDARLFTWLWATAIVLAWTPSAHAHVGGGAAGGLLTGLRHPVSGLDHVLAMIAVGLWGAQLGVPAVWLLPVAFPMMMACGGMLGLMGAPLPGVEVGIAASAIVLGAMVLVEARPQQVVALFIVAFFAIFHGHAHGTELPEGQSGLLYSVGFVMATGGLHGVGITIGLIHRWNAGRVALRLAGAVVLVAGFFFLWRAVA